MRRHVGEPKFLPGRLGDVRKIHLLKSGRLQDFSVCPFDQEDAGLDLSRGCVRLFLFEVRSRPELRHVVLVDTLHGLVKIVPISPGRSNHIVESLVEFDIQCSRAQGPLA